MKTKLRKISNNILYMPANPDTDRPILAIIKGNKRNLIIDAGNSSAHARLFLNELEINNITNLDYVVLTHWHWDHIFGINEMDLPTIANKLTYNEIEKQKNYEWTKEALDKRVQEKIEIPFCADMIKKEFQNFNDIIIDLPNFIFENKVEIDLGGITCIIEKVGGDHSSDSTIIYVKEEKVLFLGDCMFVDIYKDEDDWSYDIKTYSRLLDKIESYGAEIYVESHCEPVNKEEFLNYYNDIKKIGTIVAHHNGVEDKIRNATSKELHRDLTQEDLDIIKYFINGLK